MELIAPIYTNITYLYQISIFKYMPLLDYIYMTMRTCKFAFVYVSKMRKRKSMEVGHEVFYSIRIHFAFQTPKYGKHIYIRYVNTT